MVGHIHAIETMGLRDGPGIRTVVFMQGCHLRCRFCHNPDTWAIKGGSTVTPEELLRRVVRFRPYFERSGGGVTFSGGEPLLQSAFLLECLRLFREAGIHTCIDTAGVGCEEPAPILALTDLVLYDVKAIEAEAYRALCGRDIAETERFQAALRQAGCALTVRQVIIPGYNDSEEYLEALRAYIQTHLPTASRVELLPYHRMGAYKYEALGIPEPLGDTPPADTERVAALAARFFPDMR